MGRGGGKLGGEMNTGGLIRALPMTGEKLGLRSARMSLWVHALVKNTDDDQFALCFSIENDVLAGRMSAQPRADIIPLHPQAGCVPDRFEDVLDLA